MMSARRDWLVSVWRSDMETGVRRSMLARVGRIGLATFIALAAVMGLGTGLLVTQRAKQTPVA